MTTSDTRPPIEPGEAAPDFTLPAVDRNESAPLPVMEAAATTARMDSYAGTPTDQADMERQWPQLKGQFLIDRDGIVRWANIECAKEGLGGLGKNPPEDVILSAARALPPR